MTAMHRRTETRESMQRGLFEQGQPGVELSTTGRRPLAALIEARMIEIAAALATGEAGDDQDAEHLARSAYVYIRQSTADQLLYNHESRHRQYALADRARQLGWTTVEIVDDDLGRSGGGVARPGFDRLIGAICAGGVGAVLAIEASRLARNSRARYEDAPSDVVRQSGRALPGT
jgi:hypothetical protein